MKRLVIAIDPGFDGAKIVVNKHCYHYPFVVEDITNDISSFPVKRTDKNFVLCEMGERTYLVGEYARKSLQEAEHQDNARAEMDTFYTVGRFDTLLFNVGLNAFLGMALYDYAHDSKKDDSVEPFNIEDLSNWDIFVGVALPHQHCDELWEKSVKGYLLDHHDFTLHIGSDKNIRFKFDLKKENCVYNSQAICALLNMVCDDNGLMIDQDKTIMDYLPALILDGGYKTLGKFKLSRDGRMDKPESNSLYAMHNINEEVAAKVRDKVPGIFPYMIEDKYNNDEPIHYEDENGDVKSYNVVEMRDAITKNKALQMMEYLMREHNKLLDIKLILLAGGTGAAYYDTVKDFCDKRNNLKEKVLLANSGFDGEKCEPVYAIVIGLYKAMIVDIE